MASISARNSGSKSAQHFGSNDSSRGARLPVAGTGSAARAAPKARRQVLCAQSAKLGSAFTARGLKTVRRKLRGNRSVPERLVKTKLTASPIDRVGDGDSTRPHIAIP